MKKNNKSYPLNRFDYERFDSFPFLWWFHEGWPRGYQVREGPANTDKATLNDQDYWSNGHFKALC